MRSLNERFSVTKLSNIFDFNDVLSKFFTQLFPPQIQPTVSRCTFFSVRLSRRRFRSLAANVLAALRSGGFHYHSCGLQKFNFAQPFPRGYCRHCAKPLVRRWHLRAMEQFSAWRACGTCTHIRNICQYHKTFSRTNILSVTGWRIHIRFHYTTFSPNAARQKRLIYYLTRL
jgi:hypothetical protein